MYPYQNATLSPRERAEDLLSRMTEAEKIGQLTQSLYGFRCYERCGDTVTLADELLREIDKYGGIGAIYGLFRADPWSQKDLETGLVGTLAAKTRNRIQKYAIEQTRLGIPILFSSECPHGHQAPDGYLLPVNLASAATFSPRLVKDAFSVCGKQMRDTGVDLALVSVMDILRDPRWGRSEETFGEDPYLASQMADAVTRGIRSAGVSVVAKHFCAQGETTGGVNASAASIGERELREIHLPAARAAVEAGADAVMATYNEIDGVYCCANSRLLNEILRSELGFDGVVMSDALAINSLDSITGEAAVSAAMALRSGVDMGLLDDLGERLMHARACGAIDEHTLDTACSRVLMLKFRRGLFEHPYVDEEKDPRRYTPLSHPIVKELTAESTVLLKNDGDLLPLDANASLRIGIVGENADNPYAQTGDYTPPLRSDACITPYAGLQRYLAAHAPGITLTRPQTDAELCECDLVLAVVGGSSNRFSGSQSNENGQVSKHGDMDCGEGVDSSTLALPLRQVELLSHIKAMGKAVITVLVCGRPYEMAEIDRASNALLCAFYPGGCFGEILPHLLFGELSPAGRLPVSLPDRIGQLPVYYNHKRSYNAMRYRESDGAPRYPFGSGLTYTHFSYRLLTPPTQSEARVTVEIKNVGTRSAYAVPLLYLRRKTGIVTARDRALCAFDKCYLASGESKSVTLTIPEAALMQVDHEHCERVVHGLFEWLVYEGAEPRLCGEAML